MAKVEVKENSKVHEQFLLILDAFRRMLYNAENSAERLEVFDDIITLRASFLIDSVLDGLRIDFDRAMELLQAKNLHLTERDESERDTLIAAFDNLVDFAVAQEVAMMQELPDELDLAEMESYEAICHKYNETYAETENAQVLHAGTIAAFWLGLSAESLITYNTQNDERVRELHQSFDGLTYPKSQFPPELIPPIEWACRCYLTADGYGSVMDSILKPQIKVNPIFAESLATRGRIFTDAHPYFRHTLPPEVKAIKQRIKTKLWLR